MGPVSHQCHSFPERHVEGEDPGPLVARGAVCLTLLTSGLASGIAGGSLSRAPFPYFTAESQSFILRFPRTKWKESTALYPCPLPPWHSAAQPLWA